MKRDPNQIGVFVRSKKTFYYLETGGMLLGNNHLDTVLSTLIARSIIKSHRIDKNSKDTNEYKFISCREAEEQGLQFQPIFLTPNVKAAYEKAQSSGKSDIWNK